MKNWKKSGIKVYYINCIYYALAHKFHKDQIIDEETRLPNDCPLKHLYIQFSL